LSADSNLSSGSESSLPRWARVLDTLSIALLLLSFVIHIGGGFRLRAGPIRLSLLSWLPPMAMAVALLVARHWRLPHPTVLGRLARSYRRITSSSGWSDAWGIFVATRLAMFLVGLMAVYTIGIPDNELRFRVSENEALNLPVRWDAGWYLNITTGGYR